MTRLFRRLQPSGSSTYYRQAFACKHREATQVSTWKRQAIEGMAGVFSDKVKKAENKDGEIKDLHAKIGQLALLGVYTPLPANGWGTIFCHKG